MQTEKKKMKRTCLCGKPVSKALDKKIEKEFTEFLETEKVNKAIREFEEFSESQLDQYFPKKKCKERGQALVFNAAICLYFRHVIRTFKNN